MRQIPNFDRLLSYWRAQAKHEFQEQDQAIFGCGEAKGVEDVVAIPFASGNGEWKVCGEVNGLPLDFVLDTGATNVSLSEVEATFMRKNGYLDDRDFGGSLSFTMATGGEEEGEYVNLRQVKLGQMVLKNVRALVVKNQIAPLLLGKSVIDRFAKIEIENDNMVIRFVRSAS